MENILNDKRIQKGVFVLIIIICLFTFAKFINELKSNEYIGRENQPAYTISVSGTGEVTAVSDIATIYINLTKDGATSKEAQNLLNDSITKTLAYLKKQNIDDKDIKSEYGGLNPKYSYDQIVCVRYPCPQSEPKIIGYTATQSITVKIRAVDNANEVKTGLAEIGVTNISGPTFSIDNEDALKDQARSKAIDDAKEKAQTLARELGVRLGKVTNFSENSGGYYPMYSAKDMMSSSVSSSAPAPELPKGENKITSNVSVTYEIK